MDEMETLWRERVNFRSSERDAYQMLPPLQRGITFGHCFCIDGIFVGKIPTLSEFLDNALKHEVDQDNRDFFTACALYDAHMGWYAADMHSGGVPFIGVMHVSMAFPISEQVHNAMVAVDCDSDRLNPSDQEALDAFIAADTASTKAWAKENGVSDAG